MSSIFTSIGKGLFIGFCGIILDYIYIFNNNKDTTIYSYICGLKSTFNIKDKEITCSSINNLNNIAKNYLIITPLSYTIIDYNYVNHISTFDVVKYAFILLIQSTLQRFIMKECERNKRITCNYISTFYNSYISCTIFNKNKYISFYIIPTMISCYIVKPSELTAISSLISIVIINHPYNQILYNKLKVLCNKIKDMKDSISDNNLLEKINVYSHVLDNINNNNNNKLLENNDVKNTIYDLDTSININVAYQIGEELISKEDYVILD